MTNSATTHPKALVLGAAPEALMAEVDRQGVQGVVFCDALDQIDAVIQREQPDCLAIYHDEDFTGPDLVAAHRSSCVKWVHCSGAGFDFLGPELRHDIWITNIGQGRAHAQAQTILGAIIALNRDFLGALDRQNNRNWKCYEFADLKGQRILIIGTGAIGSALARLAKAMGMETWGISRNARAREHFDRILPYSELDAAVMTSDVISLHVPLTPETIGLFDARRLELLKPTAIFVNTARGPIVDETALAALLHKTVIAGAFLDVFEVEPLPETSPLWHAPNTILMPHNSNLTRGWRVEALKVFFDLLSKWRSDAALHNIVQSPSGKPRC